MHFTCSLGEGWLQRGSGQEKPTWSPSKGRVSGRTVPRNIMYETRGPGNHVYVCLTNFSHTSAGRLLSLLT